jgi:MFS family permease
VVLVIVERRAREPIVPVHLFKLRTFAIATSVSFVVGVAMFGAVSFLPLFLQVVNRASATNSGMLLLPLMLGLLLASIGSGQVTTRTGRYKLFPVTGTALATTAMVLLSTMGTGTSQGTVTLYMVLLGAGIGLTMQTMVLATQNVVPVHDLGAATSSVSFFRSMGGSIGVAMFGALFNSGLRSRLEDVDGVAFGESSTFTTAALDGLTGGERTEVVSAFADSLTRVFLLTAPLLGLACFLTVLLRETPLRSSVATARAADSGPVPVID